MPCEVLSGLGWALRVGDVGEDEGGEDEEEEEEEEVEEEEGEEMVRLLREGLRDRLLSWAFWKTKRPAKDCR